MAGSAVDNEVNLLPQIGQDMLSPGRADPSRRVCRWGYDRVSQAAYNLLGDLVSGQSQGNAVEAGPRQTTDGGLRFQRAYQCQWARPEMCRECPGPVRQMGDGLCLLNGTDMCDQGIEAGTSFDGKDSGDGIRISGMRAQTVNGLCRQNDKPPRRQRSHSLTYGVR